MSPQSVEWHEFGDFLTCKGVFEEEDEHAWKSEIDTVGDFFACRDPDMVEQSMDEESNSVVVDNLHVEGPKRKSSIEMSQSETMDGSATSQGQDDLSSSQDESDASHKGIAKKVMILVVRRDKSNNSMGVGMIP